MQSFIYQKQGGCCGGIINVHRTILVNPESYVQSSLIKTLRASNQEVINFKALAKRRGIIKKYNVKVGAIGSNSTIGQITQGITSYAIPGDTSILRSPLRSAAWTALTPGTPSLKPNLRAPKREYRCPEGYQYGGRFTDSKLSTCGQMLFGIPNPLGATIGTLVRRAVRGATGAIGEAVRGDVITAGPYGGDVIQSRAPQIPRVGESNFKLRSERTKEVVKQMNEVSGSPRRLVRRDGFILEPVVSATVLRAIPDNRDMVDAVYVTKLQSVMELGGEELGLLSNTGVTNLTYALPGGSSISIQKVRPLTVGERRKLGRTVNTAASIKNSRDPLARLKYVAAQTGNGIAIKENFVGIKNPHEIVASRNGRQTERWVIDSFKNKPGQLPKEEVARETVSHGGIGSKISSIDDALTHIGKGGSLSDIAPDILQQVLRKENLLKNNNGVIITPNNDKYIYKTSRNKFEHLASLFASDLQQHLGLESPDVAFVGVGDKRPYLIQDVESTLPGAQLARENTVMNLPSSDISALMVADFLSGINNRSASTITPMIYNGKPKGIATWSQSDLIDLDKLAIREATKARIEKMLSVKFEGIYGKYFAALQRDQQQLMRSQTQRLIERAQKFNITTFKTKLRSDGQLSDGELAHLDIVVKIFTNRLGSLQGSLSYLMQALGGNK